VTLSVKQFSIGAAAYQKLLEAAAKAEREEPVAAIREGLAYVHIWPHNAGEARTQSRWPRSMALPRRGTSVKYRVQKKWEQARRPAEPVPLFFVCTYPKKRLSTLAVIRECDRPQVANYSTKSNQPRRPLRRQPCRR